MSRLFVGLFVAVLVVLGAIAIYTNLSNRDLIPPPPPERMPARNG